MSHADDEAREDEAGTGAAPVPPGAAPIGWGQPHEPLDAAEYGTRAALLSQAAALGAPVPPALALTQEAVEALAGDRAGLGALLARLGAATGRDAGDLLVSLRPADHGAGAILPAQLHLGWTAAHAGRLAVRLGPEGALAVACRHVQNHAVQTLVLDRETFEDAFYDRLKAEGAENEAALGAPALTALLSSYRALVAAEGETVPADPATQIATALQAALARWTSPRAAIRRRARGLAEDLPLRLLIQVQAHGLAAPGVPARSGAGLFNRRDEASGAVVESGRFLLRAEGEEALMGLRTPAVLGRSDRLSRGLREPSLEEALPAVHADLVALGCRLEMALGQCLTLGFTVEDGTLHLLDIRSQRQSSRAVLRAAVELAGSGAITRSAALSRVSPQVLEDHLHPTLDPSRRADVLARGLAASPGAASGPLVFSPDAAEDAAARGERAILALTETGPEDIRGMHAAGGVLTVRGGMTSHAALVARGLGRPCVVGARDLALDPGAGVLTAPDGRNFRAGDALTVDGGQGRVIAGRIETRAPEITGAFATLMGWTGEARRLSVRANADTAQDAIVARGFGAEGIGLCRTEHMFFKRGRIAAMQEMILADSTEARRAALERLKPMQRDDFADLFREMAGRPVTIRLLDPPLHEFLPHGAEETAELAALLDLPVERVRARAASLAEFNPMLGRRGCRIGIAYPEIYEMQARAAFEAASEAGAATGEPVHTEIMIPLISAVRELELLRERVDAVADAVAAERGGRPSHRVGVMIETPRACLRAGEIARVADFLSFGTNDLTQMLYGLSRDDAGRFMPDYVEQGVFPHDPFHRIDEDGVGEIVRLAISRARDARPEIVIGLCGEHGGDPVSVAFCDRAGFDYVSCSPYRVPIASLAAAQARLGERAE